MNKPTPPFLIAVLTLIVVILALAAISFIYNSALDREAEDLLRGETYEEAKRV